MSSADDISAQKMFTLGIALIEVSLYLIPIPTIDPIGVCCHAMSGRNVEFMQVNYYGDPVFAPKASNKTPVLNDQLMRGAEWMERGGLKDYYNSRGCRVHSL